MIPIEIKAGKTGTLRSLHRFLRGKKRSFAVRFNADLPSALSDSVTLPGEGLLRYELLSLPIYMVGQTRRLLAQHGDSRSKRA